MLVNDVIADANMYGDGNTQPHRRSEHTYILVWELTIEDCPPNGFAEAQPSFCSGIDDVVDPSRFPPQAELPGPNVPGDALRRRADQRQFPIMYRPRSVHGDVRDRPPFHQINEVTGHAGTEYVSTTHQNRGPTPGPGRQE